MTRQQAINYLHSSGFTAEQIKDVTDALSNPVWHECFDDDPASFPDDDRLVLISFSNYPVPTVGWFMHVDDGGFWTDGTEKSFVELGLFVDGWWELPKKPERSN